MPNQWLEVEAKQIFVELDAKASKVDAAMDLAMQDACCLSAKEPCAGLVFAVLSLPAEDQTDGWDPTDYLKLFKQVDYDYGWIWCDTQVDERYRWERGKRVYPGVAVLLKRRRNK